MPLSVIYELATGRQLRVRVGTASLSVQDPATEGFVELAGLNNEPNPASFVWDAGTLQYVAAPAFQPRTVITREEFIDKWTDEELEKLHELRLIGTTLQRSRLEAIRERLTSRDTVPLDSPKVVVAVTWMVGQLAAAGVVTPNDAPTRSARVAAVLAPITDTPEE